MYTVTYGLADLMEALIGAYVPYGTKQTRKLCVLSSILEQILVSPLPTPLTLLAHWQ